jgi:hypothetical protein
MFYPPRPTYLRHACDRHLHERADGPFVIADIRPFNRYLVKDSSGKLFSLPSSQLTLFLRGGRVRAGP